MKSSLRFTTHAAPILKNIAVITVLSLGGSSLAFAGGDGNGKPNEECVDALSKSGNAKTEENPEAKEATKPLYTYLLESRSLPTSKTQLAKVMGISARKFGELFPNMDDAMAILRKYGPALDKAEKLFVTEYMKKAKDLGATPTLQEFSSQLGISVEQLQTVVRPGGLFKNLSDLKQYARDQRISFKGIVDRDIFNEEHEKALLEAVKTKQRLIVTTAVAGAEVNTGFLKAMQNYAQKNDAAIIVIPLNMETDGLDPVLLEAKGVHILTNQIWLTPYLNLNHIKLTAKMKNPFTGLEDEEESMIIGSPQLRTRIQASGRNDLEPRRFVSTGAVTFPNYDGDRYISHRTDRLAESRQKKNGMGAYILERSNGRSAERAEAIGMAVPGEFNGRHIEYIPEKNGFMDLNQFYYAESKTTETVRPEALVPGDIHVGETKQTLLRELAPLIKKYRPKRIVLHDLFNGQSVSHHDELHMITMAKKFESGQLDLVGEFTDNITFINAVLALDPEIVVVIPRANHNDWLTRWLERGGHNKSPQNHALGTYLAAAAMRGVDVLPHVMLRGWGEPYQHNTETFSVTGQSFPRVIDANRVLFLRAGEPFYVGKAGPGKDGRLVNLAEHGDKGANGGKGSLQGFYNSGDGMVYGHTHTDARIGRVVNVGTFTELRQAYNAEGLSSWVNSMALVGENGEIQAIAFVDSQWFADPKGPRVADADFFYPQYPQLVPNQQGSGEGQVDQYSSPRARRRHRGGSK